MPDGKGQPVRGQLTVEFPTSYRRLNRRRTSLWVNRELLETPKINQQAPVTKRKADPTMPPAAHGYFHPMSACKPDRLNDIMLSRDFHDQLRVARGRKLIPAHPAPEIFVLGIGRCRHLPLYATLQFFRAHIAIPLSADQ